MAITSLKNDDFLLEDLSSYNRLVMTLQSFAKNTGKLRKLRKSCNHKQKINGIYNANNCLQQLSTLRLKT